MGTEAKIQTGLLGRLRRLTSGLTSHASRLELARPPAGGLPLPISGRSSIETPTSFGVGVASFLMNYGAVNPLIPIALLDFLELAAAVNMDISDAVDKVVTLGNTGHDLVLEDSSDARIEAARVELDALAASVYPRSAGMDGLVNHYLRQLAVTGALSSEDVLTEALDGVVRVALVPVRSIRFVYADGDYQPYQRASLGNVPAGGSRGPGGLIPLNPVTYHYYASLTAENSPYAIPPMLGAIEPLLIQRDMLDNLKFVMRKLGLLGLVDLAAEPPLRKPGESDREYASRASAYLADLATAMAGNYRKGILVHYKDQEMKHFNVTGAGAAGAEQLIRVVEQFLFTGAHIDPSMVGRNYQSTETYSRVIYGAMAKRHDNFRRLIKRRIEATYRLHLLLRRLEVAGVGIRFHATDSLNPNIDELAETYKVGSVIRKMDKGIIDPDQAAQELGYDSAADPERALAAPTLGGLPIAFARAERGGLRTRRFRFDAQAQRYRFERPRLTVHGSRFPGHPHRAPCTVHCEQPEFTELSWISDYLKALAPTAEAARTEALRAVEELLRKGAAADYATPEAFADAVYEKVQAAYGSAFAAAGVEGAVQAQIRAAYGFFRLADASLFGGSQPVAMSFDSVDIRSQEFLAEVDRFYLSKFVENDSMTGPAWDFLKDQYLEKGGGLFGRGDPALLDQFRKQFGDDLEGLTDSEVQRIVDSAIGRTKNWGHIGQLAEAGFDGMIVINGANPCDLCREMAERSRGHALDVAAARSRINEMTGLSAESFNAALGAGTDFPTYHPNCHCRVGPAWPA
jgi:hypothetical protein